MITVKKPPKSKVSQPISVLKMSSVRFKDMDGAVEEILASKSRMMLSEHQDDERKKALDEQQQKIEQMQKELQE